MPVPEHEPLRVHAGTRTALRRRFKRAGMLWMSAAAPVLCGGAASVGAPGSAALLCGPGAGRIVYHLVVEPG